MKKMICLLLALLMLMSMAACTPNQENSSTQSSSSSEGSMETTPKYEVNKDRNEAIVDDAGTVTVKNEGNARVFYEIFVGSFSDSNGDGIGDLRGIIERFDYLNDGDDNSGLSLGVEGIWLTPIFESPSYHKYDVADYYKIDPDFGTMDDLQELIELCHSRDVKLILDLPINHTSRDHQWFTYFGNAHRAEETDSPYYEYYSYAEKGEAGKTYSAISGTNKQYECNFSGDMPELNFDNEDVRLEVLDIAKFYLEMGIDGFRFDAAKYIYYGENPKCVDFWNWYLGELRAVKPDVYTVAEVWDADGTTFPYFEATNCFNFTISQSSGTIATAAKGEDADRLTAYVESYIATIRKKNPDAMILPFIANHDTDRAAGFLTPAKGHAYVAASLNLLMPGSPYIYYGEEIGMKGSRGSANTDANRRLAMLWGDDDTVKDPTGTTYKVKDQINGTVAQQLPDGYSLLNHYKKLIMIRKANPEIATGEYKALNLSGKLGGFLSTLDGKSVAVIHNTTTEPLTLDLSTLPELAAMKIAAFAGLGGATLEGTVLTIEAQTSVVLR